MTAEVAVIGLDPGRNLGVAQLTAAGDIVHLHVLPGGGAQLQAELTAGTLAWPDAPIALGDGTGHQEISAILTAHDYTFTLIDEKNSSREARELYFRLHPPRGLLRLVPRGMLSGPALIDSYAAAIIAQRYLAG